MTHVLFDKPVLSVDELYAFRLSINKTYNSCSISIIAVDAYQKWTGFIKKDYV
jgi:hypothetical protein